MKSLQNKNIPHYSEVAESISMGKDTLQLSAEAAFNEGKSRFEGFILKKEASLLEAQHKVDVIEAEIRELVTNKGDMKILKLRIDNAKKQFEANAKAAAANLEQTVIELSSRRVTNDTLNLFEKVYSASAANDAKTIESFRPYADAKAELDRLMQVDLVQVKRSKLADAEQEVSEAKAFVDYLKAYAKKSFGPKPSTSKKK